LQPEKCGKGDIERKRVGKREEKVHCPSSETNETSNWTLTVEWGSMNTVDLLLKA